MEMLIAVVIAIALYILFVNVKGRKPKSDIRYSIKIEGHTLMTNVPPLVMQRLVAHCVEHGLKYNVEEC